MATLVPVRARCARCNRPRVIGSGPPCVACGSKYLEWTTDVTPLPDRTPAAALDRATPAGMVVK